ncbi:hypothetical protein [Virgibacillus sp. SK37]|uniref:hypothetical protein n=1 Tax=Virgibacillus sp. SK37 TaxID=403957 RepID=UPI0004D1B26F|nr:hypothetical protein [Virgibacillus sp. SK37]AIF45256.1 hypothetical protein X953_06060 [Virgibacillus sp. SK37]
MGGKLISTFVLLILLFSVGCSGQKVINVQGESQNWSSRIAYEIGEHEQIGKGKMEYTGSEQLKSLSYEINYPETFSVGGSGDRSNIKEDETTFQLTISLPDDNVDMLPDKVGDILITVMWETIAGESFEETIEFSSE